MNNNIHAASAVAKSSRGDAQKDAMPAELPLHKLRRSRGLSQQLLAELMNVKQPIVAKQERQANMNISTLRSHVEAMGGKLEIVACFSEGKVRISNF